MDTSDCHPIAYTHVDRFCHDRIVADQDALAIEEPLEIRLVFGPVAKRSQKSLTITMRTPGNDVDLSLGFLFTESIIKNRGDIIKAANCGPSGKGGWRNVVRVELQPELDLDWSRLERHFYTSSSCGVCGKNSLEAVRVYCDQPLVSNVRVSSAILRCLPERLYESQAVFAKTGGLHAAALCTTLGQILRVREDVGRHNGVDKLIGSYLREDEIVTAGQCVLLVSGRASFELVQKSLVAGIPIFAAIGAPSSLAVELAERFGVTLIGFLRDHRFNIYTHGWRVMTDKDTTQ